MGGDPDLCYEVAMWGFPAGLIGGRIYFLITTPSQIPDHWWGPFAIWKGGLGIWGGIAAGAAAGLYIANKRLSPRRSCAGSWTWWRRGCWCAQAIGRIGNYFNQELFGGRPSCRGGWRSPARTGRQLAPKYWNYATFQPTFLYEMIWNLALAGFLVWLGQNRRVRPPGVFALYVAGYSRLPDLRGDAPDRLLQPHPRAAAELLRRVDAVSARAGLVRRDPAGLARARRPQGRAGRDARDGAEAQAGTEAAAAVSPAHAASSHQPVALEIVRSRRCSTG